MPGGGATVGTCDMNCNMIKPYIAVLVIAAFAKSLMRVPMTVLILRLDSRKKIKFSISSDLDNQIHHLHIDNNVMNYSRSL